MPVAAPVARVDAHKGHIMALAFSTAEAGSLLATASNDHVLKVWRMGTGITGSLSLSCVWESGSRAAGGHSSSVSAVTWASGGSADIQQMLFSGSWDGTVKVWSGVRPNKVGATVGAGAALTDGPAASPDEIAPLRTLVGHEARVTGLAVAPAGDVLVSVAADYTARLWRLRDSFGVLAVFTAGSADGIFTSVAAGSHVFVTGSDAGVQVWPMRPNGPFASRFTITAGADVGAGAGLADLPTALPIMPAAAGGVPAARSLTDSSTATGATPLLGGGGGRPRMSEDLAEGSATAAASTPLLSGRPVLGGVPERR